MGELILAQKKMPLLQCGRDCLITSFIALGFMSHLTSEFERREEKGKKKIKKKGRASKCRSPKMPRVTKPGGRTG